MITEKIEGYGVYFSGCKNLDLLNVSMSKLQKGDMIDNYNKVKSINHNTKIALIVGK